MGNKQKQSRKKKLKSRKRTHQHGTAQPKGPGTLASMAPAIRDRDLPVLFLMLVIIAIPVLGPTLYVQGLAWLIRLSFLLPVLPLLLIYIAYKKSAITISLQPLMLALWGIVLLAVITSLWAVNTYGAISGSVKWFYVLLMSIAVYSLARDADTHHRIIIACALAGGYMALVGVTQYLFGHEIYITPVGQYPWPSATSGHKNMASQFVVVTLPFALYFSLTAKKSIGFWIANPWIALMLAYIVHGRARQVFVALFVQILIILVAVCFKRSRRLLAPRSPTRDYYYSIIASLILFVMLILAPPFDKPFSWEKSAVSEFASRTEVFTQPDETLNTMSAGRLATWIKTVNMARNHPAGVGLNNWTVHYPKYNAEAGSYYLPPGDDVWGEAHNDYLQLLAELGPPFLLIAGLMILGLWKTYALIWAKGDEASQRRSLFIGMGLMALFTVMMFSFPLTRTATPIYLGVYLGLLSAMASFSLSAKAERRVAFSSVVFAILLLLSVVGSYFSYRELSGWSHGFLAKAIGEKVFQPGENNPYANSRMMLLLAQHTDKAMEMEPYAPTLLRDSIITYTNLSLKTGDQKLADTYRNKALETALRHLSMSPYDSKTHMIVASWLQVPNEMAMEHIGKAIALDPANLQLFEQLKSIALPARQFDQALSYYEYYIPRFFNQQIHEDYAYFGMQANQQERVINTLSSIDLTRRFTPGSSEYETAKKKLDLLIEELQSSM